MKIRNFGAVLTIFAFVLQSAAFVNASVPATAIYSAPKTEIDKIIDEGMNRSKVIDHIWHLTEGIGPRLTNSPNMRRASEWTRQTLEKWGLKTRLEPFGPWGVGWSLQDYRAVVIEPDFQPVLAYPNAWSPPTPGPVTAEVVYLDTSNLDELMTTYKGKLKDKIVLVSEPRELSETFPGVATRFDEKGLNDLIKAGEAAKPERRGPPDPNDPRLAALARMITKSFRIGALIASERPAAVIETSMMGSQGALMVHSATLYVSPNDPSFKALGSQPTPWSKNAKKFMFPQMTMANEDYNRLVRMVQRGTNVKMTVDIRSTYHEENEMADNVIAEIPGTDPKLKDEVVMLGAHLDSWHASKGATDNAAGSGVVMEAVRILTAAGLKPRRTIRLALWSGEEQGLNGSKAYVSEHLGILTRPTKDVPEAKLTVKPEFDKLSAYFNLDNGGGKIRGLYLMGNSAVKPIFDEWLKPFNEMGATTTTLMSRGSTDHVSFDNIGLPGFGFIQDPLNYSLVYGPRSHHTNLDNFDRIIPDDMKQAATVMAAFVYQAAMMDEKLPRKELPGKLAIGTPFNLDAHAALAYNQYVERVIGCGHEVRNEGQTAYYPGKYAPRAFPFAAVH